jgi:hypothetical protein
MSIDDIRERLANCPIPLSAQADWQGTSHFEITDPCNSTGAYFWLDYIEEALDSNTEAGKRLGACLDYAVAYRKDVTDLLAEITRLKGTRGKSE